MISSLKNFFAHDEKDPAGTRRRQVGLFVGSIVIFTVFISLIFILPGGGKAKKVPFSVDGNGTGKTIKLSGVTDGAKAEDRWLEEAETKLQKLDKLADENTKLQAEVEELKKQAHEAKAHQGEVVDHKVLVDGYYKEMTRLQERLNNLESPKPNQAGQVVLPQGNNPPFGPVNAATAPQAPQAEMEQGGIMSIDFPLGDGDKDAANLFRTGEYLPAGSYVAAVIISGVDASVGVSSQSDPRPVLFRVTGDAVSAIYDGEAQKVDIKGCVVTGAASGDLSSEKVFVRLLKMTCSREAGTVIETEVHGYVTAVGKAGVRGPVVSREGDLVTKSFFAGLASGVGSATSQSLTSPATIVGGVATTETTAQNIVGQGLGTGVENSADRLAEYLISRAEQYQPVITMAAGIDVELVFNDGVYLDGKSRQATGTIAPVTASANNIANNILNSKGVTK